MTRIEEIVKEAKHREKEEGFTQLVKDTKGICSAYGIGFLEGAEWADKTMIDKVCEWLEDNIYDYLYINRDFNEADYKNELIEDLRKAMDL